MSAIYKFFKHLFNFQKGHDIFNTPTERQNREVYVMFTICILCLTFGVLLTKENVFVYLIGSLSYSYLLLMIIEILNRISLLIEEIHHIHTRYKSDFLQLLYAVFSFNRNSTVIGMLAAIYAVLHWQEGPATFINSAGLLSSTMTLIAVTLFTRIIHLEHSPLDIAKKMEQLHYLDYGSGMAFSFFYGYLNLILPSTGDERKGLKEQIDIYESKHGVQFRSKKLFLLIPISAYCPKTLSEVSERIQLSKIPAWRVLDRAGVKDRVYHNTVYKIEVKKNQTPVYVCAEYASALQTFYEVTGHSNFASDIYKKFRNEIVSNFYHTLRKLLLNNRDMHDLCELIFFKDVGDDGYVFDRSQVDIADLLLEYIR